jgi:transposase-like protein
MKLTVDEMISKEAVEAAVQAMKNGTSKGATIRTLFAGGMEVKDISVATGIRYNHVYNVVKNEVLVNDLEVEKSSRSSENSKKAQIVKLLSEGKSITQVAQELHCLYNYVWQVAKAANMTGTKVELKEVSELDPAAEVAKPDRPTLKNKKEVKVG